MCRFSGKGIGFYYLRPPFCPAKNYQKAFCRFRPKEPIVDILTKNFRVVEWAFKLCQGLNTMIKFQKNELYELTDLLIFLLPAILLAMTGENRVLAKLGLKP